MRAKFVLFETFANDFPSNVKLRKSFTRKIVKGDFLREIRNQILSPDDFGEAGFIRFSKKISDFEPVFLRRSLSVFAVNLSLQYALDDQINLDFVHNVARNQ